MNRRSVICNSLPLFTNTLTQIFQTVTLGREAAKALVTLRQGRRSVSDYAIDFRTLAADSGWNQLALVDAFFNGLSERLKDHLTPLDLPSELEALIALASRIDKRLLQRERMRLHPVSQRQGFVSSGPSSPPQTTAPVKPVTTAHESEEPMQIGHIRLSPEECLRRRNEGRCIYCAQLGHFLSNCSVCCQGSFPLNSELVSPLLSKHGARQQYTSVSISNASHSSCHTALVDSGADASFMDKSLINKLQLPRLLL